MFAVVIRIGGPDGPSDEVVGERRVARPQKRAACVHPVDATLAWRLVVLELGDDNDTPVEATLLEGGTVELRAALLEDETGAELVVLGSKVR